MKNIKDLNFGDIGEKISNIINTTQEDIQLTEELIDDFIDDSDEDEDDQDD